MAPDDVVSGGPAPPAPAGVRVLAWPLQRDIVERARSEGVPLLVVVEDGSEPPGADDCCEDWMWRSGGERELRFRMHHLSLRALRHGLGVATLDELGTLRLGLRTVQLPPKERVIVAVLLERFGRPIPREELTAAVWPDGVSGPNVIASRISTLRARIRWLGLEIAGCADGGYCLRTSDGAARGAPGGSEDDIVLT